MNKKLMALAVTSVFTAPAFAQAPSGVTLYGRANLGLDNYAATGATAANSDMKARNRVYDSGSRLGVRGVEDLGGGLRAVFQIESGVNMDNGGQNGQAGTANSSAGFLGSRPSFVGLEGGFGRLTFGRQDVWWGNGTISQTGANYVSTDMPFLTGNNGRVQAGIARQSNVMQYTTPTFGGFNTTLSYSPDTGPNGPTGAAFVNSESQQANLNVDARLLALTARWAGGPISVQVDYSQKQAASVAGVTNRPKNVNLKASAGFTYSPGAQLSMLVSQLKNNDVLATAGFSALGDDVKSTAIGLMWEHAFGPIQALAQAGIVRKATGCTESVGAVAGVSGSTCEKTGAKVWMLGARYNLSKRTASYLTFNQTKNDANATMDYTGGSYTSSGAAGYNLLAGSDPRIISLGVWHQF